MYRVPAANELFRLSLIALTLWIFSNPPALSHKSAVVPSGSGGVGSKLNGKTHQKLSVGAIQSGIFQFGSADVRHFVVAAQVPVNTTVSNHCGDRSAAYKSTPQLYGYVIETNKHSGFLEVVEQLHHRRQKLRLPIDSSGSACRVWAVKAEKNRERKVVLVTVKGKAATLKWLFVIPQAVS